MCRAPKGWRTQKAEKNENVDPKKKDENVTEESPGKDHDSAESKQFEPIWVTEGTSGLVALMDIREPLTNLKRCLEKKLYRDSSQFDFWLRGTQRLEENMTLSEYCVQEEGQGHRIRVDLKVESDGKINIEDVRYILKFKSILRQSENV